MIHEYLQEVRQSVRTAVRRPGFSLLVVVIVAVGIGSSTGIFSVVDSVLLQAIPYPDADRLVLIWDANAERAAEQMNVSLPKVRDLQASAESFDKIGVSWSPASMILSGDSGAGEPLRLTASIVSPDLLELTGVEPVVGRIFRPDEDSVPGGDRVVILSHQLWQRAFAGDVGVIGRQITLSDASYTVVGVLPGDFVDFPFPAQETDVWVPLMMASEIIGVDVLEARTARVYVTLARLSEGVSREQALAELQGISENLGATYPETDAGWSSVLDPLRKEYVGTFQPPLLGLVVGAGLLLLIGCANITSLLLVRASHQLNELTTRIALGASRGRILRQALTETLILVLTGGLLGIVVASSSVEALAASVPVDWPRFIEFKTDPYILALALAATIGIGVATAILSVLPSLRSKVCCTLPSTARVISRAGGGLRRALMIGEVTVAVTLLIGAGLMVRSITNLQQADVGFDAEGLVALRLDTPTESYSADRLETLGYELVDAVEALSEVDSSYIWSPQVPGESSWYTVVRPQDRPEARDDELPLVRFHYVGPGALEGIGLRFIEGRGITRKDAADGDGAIVLSQSAAQALWPGEGSALGKVVRRWNRERWLTVVGITEDAKLSGRQGLGSDTNQDVYFSFVQDPQNEIVVLGRTSGDPGAALQATREAVESVTPAVPAYDVETMETRLAEQEALPRFTALLAATFGASALFLASIGLYGVLAYTVCTRTREFGLRIALGARPGRIVRGILYHGIGLSVIGITVGMAASFALTRWLDSLLFEVSSTDPLTFIAIPVLLLLVAIVACAIPARRALCVDPQEALRAD